MSASELENVKALLRSVLIGSKEGITLKKLPYEYKMLTGESRLPIFNFPNTDAFLRSIPDVARPARNDMGEIVYHGVANEATRHIQRMVAKQRGNTKRSNRSSRRRPLLPRPRQSYPYQSSNYKSYNSRPASNTQHGTSYRRPATQGLLPLYPNGRSNTYQAPSAFERTVHFQPQAEMRRPLAEKKSINNNFTITIPNTQTNMAKKWIKTDTAPRFEKRKYITSTSLEGDKTTVHVEPAHDYTRPLHVHPASILPRITIQPKSVTPSKHEQLSPTGNTLTETIVDNIIELLRDKPSGIWLDSLETEYSNTYTNSPVSDMDSFVTARGDTFSIERFPSMSPERAIVRLKQPSNVPPHPPLDVGTPVSVTVTWLAKDTGELWLQTRTDHVEEFGEDVKSLSEKSVRLHDRQLEVGLHCVALYADDNTWYRAKILDNSVTDDIRVLFIDYGNEAKLKAENIRRLDTKLATTPALAIQSRLHQVEPKQGFWDMTVIDAMWEAMGESDIEAIPRETHDGLVYIDLYRTDNPDMSISEMLTNQGILESTKPIIPKPQPKTVFLRLDPNYYKTSSFDDRSHDKVDDYSPYDTKQSLADQKDETESVASSTGSVRERAQPQPPAIDLPEDNFWDISINQALSASHISFNIIGDEFSERLFELQSVMEEWYRQTDTQPHIHDDDTCIGIMEDGSYCRVRVMDTSNVDTADCYMLDYGDRATIQKSALRIITAEVNVLPYQCIKATLAGLESLSNNTIALGKLVELIGTDTSLIAQVHERTPHILITLFNTSTDDDVNVNTEIAEACGVKILHSASASEADTNEFTSTDDKSPDEPQPPIMVQTPDVVADAVSRGEKSSSPWRGSNIGAVDAPSVMTGNQDVSMYNGNIGVLDARRVVLGNQNVSMYNGDVGLNNESNDTHSSLWRHNDNIGVNGTPSVFPQLSQNKDNVNNADFKFGNLSNSTQIGNDIRLIRENVSNGHTVNKTERRNDKNVRGVEYSIDMICNLPLKSDDDDDDFDESPTENDALDSFKTVTEIRQQIGVNVSQGFSNVLVKYDKSTNNTPQYDANNKTNVNTENSNVDKWLQSTGLHQRDELRASSPSNQALNATCDDFVPSFNATSMNSPAVLDKSLRYSARNSPVVEINRNNSTVQTPVNLSPKDIIDNEYSHILSQFQVEQNLRKTPPDKQLKTPPVFGTSSVWQTWNKSPERDIQQQPPYDLWDKDIYWGLKVPSVVKVTTEDGYVDLHVNSVISPSQISFQMYKNKQQIDSMMVQLQMALPRKSERRLKMSELKINHMYAGSITLGEEHLWHRIVIKEVNSFTQEAVANLVDYGAFCLINLDDIHPLPLLLWDLPIQSFNGAITNIKPLRGDEWSESSKYWLITRISEQDFVAKIYNYDHEKAIYTLALIDTSDPIRDADIGKELVEHEYAREVVEWTV